jgi:hypothetical protein
LTGSSRKAAHVQQIVFGRTSLWTIFVHCFVIPKQIRAKALLLADAVAALGDVDLRTGRGVPAQTDECGNFDMMQEPLRCSSTGLCSSRIAKRCRDRIDRKVNAVADFSVSLTGSKSPQQLDLQVIERVDVRKAQTN